MAVVFILSYFVSEGRKEIDDDMCEKLHERGG